MPCKWSLLFNLLYYEPRFYKKSTSNTLLCLIHPLYLLASIVQNLNTVCFLYSLKCPLSISDLIFVVGVLVLKLWRFLSTHPFFIYVVAIRVFQLNMEIYSSICCATWQFYILIHLHNLLKAESKTIPSWLAASSSSSTTTAATRQHLFSLCVPHGT